MRVHPGVGSPLWRITPKGGATICGHLIPEGTEVGMSAWAVHQDKKVFGEDANIFRPERWLDADPERMASMDRAFFSVCSHSSMAEVTMRIWADLFSLATAPEHASVSRSVFSGRLLLYQIASLP